MRAELAEFLRDRRSRVGPADVGLEARGGRRTPGLRREEVARLAGISVDYYIRMEQGRGPRPSRQVLNALAAALRLSDDERNYLFRLVGEAPSVVSSREVPASVLRLLERFDDVPALVLDVKYDILAWNRMAVGLMGDFGRRPEKERNMLWWMFCHRPSVLETEHGRRFAKSCVASVRAAGRYPGDPGVRALVDELGERNPAFAEMWAAHEVQVQRSTPKRGVHPVFGELELDCEVLLIPELDQRLMFFTAPEGSPTGKALQELRNWDRQT
ncbi:helix-turn-helix transcriptional regulator [Saccharopolyspora shandongensis]|uniref:helix-turn-helix transcriptional regulator n=1 Tax=Saccharopolyspora shandongensis TaxID=418495 RepID=UPI0033F938B8